MPKTKASFYIIAATVCTVAVMFVLPITPKIPVSTTVIERGDLISTQSLEGLVGYRNEQVSIAPVAGQVVQVLAVEGQAVCRGEVLVRLDTSLEEQALARLEQTLSKQQEADASIGQASDTVQAVWLQNQLTLETQINELTLGIQGKTLRSPIDGVIEQVYVAQGAYVASLSPVLSVRSNQLELCAWQRVQESKVLQPGMRAVVYSGGQQHAVATLSSFEAPFLESATGQMMQTLHFSIDQGEEWLQSRLGETVTIEVLERVDAGVALAPIAAVSKDNAIWVIREGKVIPLSVDPRYRDADYVQVADELVGEKVVLLPDGAGLHPGSLVKESRR